jgi:hypothetical protein
VNTALREYDIAIVDRLGHARVHQYAQDEPLGPGAVLRLEGRFWLVDSVEDRRATAKPARYRIRLRHPDGGEEAGAFRRYRADAPRLGHRFSTLEDGRPVSWAVVDQQLAHDEGGAPYLDLVAERDYEELEEVPDHELEHMLARRQAVPEPAVRAIADAQSAGLSAELVALEPGEVPDWDEAARFLDALTIEMVDDDLLEQCGVDPDTDPRERWIEIVRARLRADLERFRADVEADRDEMEQWEFLDGRVFAAFGSPGDEFDPDAGYGWLCRLLDAGVLGAAGFRRVRKPELQGEPE